MLKGKDYVAVDTIYIFISAFQDNAIGRCDKPSVTAIQTFYSNNVKQLVYTKNRKRESTYWRGSRKWKELTAENVGEETIRKVGSFRSIHAQIAYAWQQFLTHISVWCSYPRRCVSTWAFFYFVKKFIKLTSMRRGSTLHEAVKAENSSVAVNERINNTGGGVRKAKHVRDSTWNLSKL